MEEKRAVYFLSYGEDGEYLKMRLTPKEASLIGKLCDEDVIYQGSLMKDTEIAEFEF